MNPVIRIDTQDASNTHTSSSYDKTHTHTYTHISHNIYDKANIQRTYVRISLLVIGIRETDNLTLKINI